MYFSLCELRDSFFNSILPASASKCRAQNLVGAEKNDLMQCALLGVGLHYWTEFAFDYASSISLTTHHSLCMTILPSQHTPDVSYILAKRVVVCPICHLMTDAFE